MPANAQQVQAFVDTRVRPIAEAVRELRARLEDYVSSVGDVYAAVNDSGFVWTDSRGDAPPHLMTKADVLEVNAGLQSLRDDINGNAFLPKILEACVRPI